MANIPGKKARQFYERKWVVEALSVVPPIVTAAYVAYAASRSLSTAEYVPLLLGGIIWLVVASIVKVLNAYQQDKQEKAKDGHDGLSAALHVLHANIAKQSKLSDKNDGTLRITIHRVVPPLAGPDQLEQLLPYLGGDGGEAGRVFSIRSGITGRVAREKTPYVYARQNDDFEAYVKELIRDWGFTDADARKLNPNMKSSMAVPIFTTTQVVAAVVYMDSTKNNLFSESVIATVINSCGGIATYISERYK